MRQVLFSLALLPVCLCDCFIESGWEEAHWDPSWLLSCNEALSTSPNKVGHKQQESGLRKVAQRELQSVPSAEKKKRWRKSKRGRGREKRMHNQGQETFIPFTLQLLQLFYLPGSTGNSDKRNLSKLHVQFLKRNKSLWKLVQGTRIKKGKTKTTLHTRGRKRISEE